jgi:hypothetical protein
MTGNEKKSLKRAINDPDLLISKFSIWLKFIEIENKDTCDVVFKDFSIDGRILSYFHIKSTLKEMPYFFKDFEGIQNHKMW